jgi:hypothetical protein
LDTDVSIYQNGEEMKRTIMRALGALIVALLLAVGAMQLLPQQNAAHAATANIATTTNPVISIVSSGFRLLNMQPLGRVELTSVKNATVKVYAPEAGTLSGVASDGSLTYSNGFGLAFNSWTDVTYIAPLGAIAKGALFYEAQGLDLRPLDNNGNTSYLPVTLLWSGQLIDANASDGKTFAAVTRVDWINAAKAQITRSHHAVWQVRVTFKVYYFGGSRKIETKSTDLNWVKSNHQQIITDRVEGRTFKTLATSLPARNAWKFKALGQTSQR